MRDDFYRAVQAKFEGAEDAQRMRLHGYLPFVYPLLHTYPAAPALELGSSSSSAWSQLLRESDCDNTLCTQVIDLFGQANFNGRIVGRLQRVQKIALVIITNAPHRFLKLFT